jgi:deazaflavin-dependent oxidoreductase (nitroreductase family)
VSSDAPERFLYLTTTGRVSGEPRTIEIWFVERRGRYYIIAERREKAQWVQNLERDPAVRFRVGARDEEGQAVRRKRELCASRISWRLSRHS